MPALAGVIYTALFALYSMLFWLQTFFNPLLEMHSWKFVEKIPTNYRLLPVLLAVVVLLFVIWRLDSAPATNDAQYASGYD